MWGFRYSALHYSLRVQLPMAYLFVFAFLARYGNSQPADAKKQTFPNFCVMVMAFLFKSWSLIKKLNINKQAIQNLNLQRIMQSTVSADHTSSLYGAVILTCTTYVHPCKL